MGYAADDVRLNALKMDRYQMSMVYAKWKYEKKYGKPHPQEAEGVSYVHWRMPAFEGGAYTAAVGQEEVIDFINKFKYTPDKIAYLASRKNKSGGQRYEDEFLHEFLPQYSLNADIDFLREGDVATTAGPAMRVAGDRTSRRFVESTFLNIMNRNSKVGTLYSHTHEAAEGVPIADFGLRRAAETGVGHVRAAFICGAVATSDMDAAEVLNIPDTGTMAHAWMEDFQDFDRPNTETELEAFKVYLEMMQDDVTVLLIDTYNDKQGLRNAIRASIETGVRLDGVRTDTGDARYLYEFTLWADKELKAAAKEHPELFSNTKIFLTNRLFHKPINQMHQWAHEETGKKFPAGSYGVGTEGANPGPHKGGVYKSCARTVISNNEPEPQGVMKVAGINSDDPLVPSVKASIPGEKLDIVRLWKGGGIIADIIVDHALGDYREMLKGGKVIDMRDNKTEVTLPDFDKAETLLVPAFKRNALGKMEYVYQEPPKVQKYNGEWVTDLNKIQHFHLATKAALPAAVRRIENAERLPCYIDPRVHAKRIEIIKKTYNEQTPKVEAQGSFHASGSAQQSQQQI